MKAGDRVFVRPEGREGTIVLMIGLPAREVWVELDVGAGSRWEFVWLGRPGKTDPECLNRYTPDQLEVVA